MRDPVMNRRTLNRLPALEGAWFQGPCERVPGVLSVLTSEAALGLLLTHDAWQETFHTHEPNMTFCGVSHILIHLHTSTELYFVCGTQERVE